jgi:hypothetical protein
MQDATYSTFEIREDLGKTSRLFHQQIIPYSKNKRNKPIKEGKKSMMACGGVTIKCILKERFKWLRKGTSFCAMWGIWLAEG